MDLSEFLEKDIKKYLDEQVVVSTMPKPRPRPDDLSVFSLTRDYAKEAREALQQGNLLKARQVLEDLKREALTFQPNTFEWEKANAVMLEVKSAIQDYLEKNVFSEEAGGEGDLGRVENAVRSKLNMLRKAITENELSLATRLYKELYADYQAMPAGEEKMRLYSEVMEVYPKLRQALQEKKRKDYLHGEKEVAEKIEQVKELVMKRDARGAVKAYKELREAFHELDAPATVKEELFKDVLALKKSVQELEKREEAKKFKPSLKLVIKKKEETPLQRFQKSKLKVYKYLDKGSLSSALTEYKRLKNLFSKLGPGEEKERAYKEMVLLHERLLTAKKKKAFSTDELWREAEAVNKLIDQGKVLEAESLFIELQHKVISMPMSDEKKELYRELDAIQNRIHLARSVQRLEEKVQHA